MELSVGYVKGGGQDALRQQANICHLLRERLLYLLTSYQSLADRCRDSSLLGESRQRYLCLQNCSLTDVPHRVTCAAGTALKMPARSIDSHGVKQIFGLDLVSVQDKAKNLVGKVAVRIICFRYGNSTHKIQGIGS